MSYNKAREERKWKQWKEKEEKLLRIWGMDENSIQELRCSDWEEFKAERCYQDHRAVFPAHVDFESPAIDEQEIDDITLLLDSIDDERLLHILLDTDRRTLQVILMKMMGFSVPEIADGLELSQYSVYNRIKRLKKKIKKNL